MTAPLEDLPGGPDAPNAPGGPDSADACPDAPDRDKNAIQAASEIIAAQKEPLRVVFMGSPQFAADILTPLLQAPFVRVAAVYTQPDRPAGRGKKLKAPELKILALERGLPLFQPSTFKAGPEGDAARAQLASLAPDVLITAAYGLILPQSVLDIPRLMPVNVHASLLPKYRGAAPIQRAIMAGEAVTGVTVMRMEAGLDSGPILMQRAVGIGINDTAADLHLELAREGAELLLLALERLSAGTLHEVSQDQARASHAPKLGKDESRLDLRLPARNLHARIRGLTPWPGALLRLVRPGKEDLTLLAEPGIYPLSPGMSAAVAAFAAKEGGGSVSPGSPAPAAPGGPGSPSCASAPPGSPAPGSLIGLTEGALLVACGGGAYAFTRLRPSGGKSMSAADFANGYLTCGMDKARIL